MAKSMLRWLRGLFFKNFALKALSLVLATLSFYSIRSAISFEVRYDVPVEVRVEKGVAVLDQNPRSVAVTFRGSQENLRNLDQKYMKAIVRPRLAEYGRPQQLTLSHSDLSGIAGVRVVDVRPNIVSVTFDREHTKVIPVLTPKTIGHPLLGKAELEYEPRFVTIRGPNLRLQETLSVTTEPVDVDGRVESFTKQVRVLSPGATWVSQIEPPEVTVQVRIVHETAVRTVEKVRVLSVSYADSGRQVLFEPTHVDVSLHGRGSALENIPDSEIQAFVNCAGLDPGATYELPVQVYLPPETGVTATVAPQSVKATFVTP